MYLKKEREKLWSDSKKEIRLKSKNYEDLKNKRIWWSQRDLRANPSVEDPFIYDGNYCSIVGKWYPGARG